jgi:hypothetical protein
MYVDAHTNSRVVIFGMSPSMIKMLLRASLLAVCGTSGTHAKYPLYIMASGCKSSSIFCNNCR